MKQKQATNALPPWHNLAAHIAMKASVDVEKAVFIFTAAKRGEGCTTGARHVAAFAAQTGRKTALLEISSEAPARYTSLARLEKPIAFDAQEKEGYATWRLPELFTELPTCGSDPRQWAQEFDILIIDAPPTSAFITQYLAPRATGIVLVVNSRKTGSRELQEAAHCMENLGGKIEGAVLNRHGSPIPRWLDRWGDRPQ